MDESQKSQTRTLEGSIAPHCKHVFVTGAFCAADASTPVRREHSKHSTARKSQAEIPALLFRIKQPGPVRQARLLKGTVFE